MHIYSGTHLVHYGQIGLWDSGDPAAYPAPTGPLPWWGPKGVVVPACSDEQVTLTICERSGDRAAHEHREDFQLLSEGAIQIDSGSVTVGNITTASTVQVPLQSGRYTVRAYHVGPDPAAAKEVLFVVEYVGS